MSESNEKKPDGQKKPPPKGESVAARQIREAMERGELDELPGKGRPIAGLEADHDEDWWLREKLRREEVSYLPPSLVLRKEVEDAVASALEAAGEDGVREVIRYHLAELDITTGLAGLTAIRDASRANLREA